MPNHLDVTRRLHERLLDIVRTALPLMPSVRAEADLAGLAYLRGEMVEALEAYCVHAHGRLKLARCASASQPDRTTAAALVENCIALRAAYDTFRRRWEHRTAAGNWYEYRLSAIVMMKQVRDHVRTVEAIRTVPLGRAA